MAETKATPDYANWDAIDRFNSDQAAALWFEFEPKDRPPIQPQAAQALAREIERRFRDNGYQGLLITRSDLLILAEEKGVRPPFLFPEERKPTTREGEPDPRHRKTLLRIIAALLDLAKFDPNEAPTTTARKVKDELERKGATMKPDTIAAVIRDARELDDD